MQNSIRLSHSLRVWLILLYILFNLATLRVVGGVLFEAPPSCNQTCDFIEFGKDAYCGGRNLTNVPQYCNHSVLLDLRGNNLHDLPKGSFQSFGELKFLDLSENNLERIRQNAFSGATKLQDIYMFNNFLLNVDHDAFAETGNIRSIYLSRNYIQALPTAAFRGLPNLHVLFISENQLSYIHRHQFLHNTQLTHISLAQNQIEVIFLDTFKHLAKLQYLDLSYNQLHILDSSPFSRMPNLHTLKLLNNSLNHEFITEDLLGSPKLNMVDLSYNNIEYVPDDVKISSLGKLRLAHNPLVCDCSIQRLQEFYETLSGEDWVAEVTCMNGEPLVTTPLICPTTTEFQQPQMETTTSVPYHHIPTMAPLIIVAIIITIACLFICIYVITCWIRACFKDDQDYKKVPQKNSVNNV